MHTLIPRMKLLLLALFTFFCSSNGISLSDLQGTWAGTEIIAYASIPSNEAEYFCVNAFTNSYTVTYTGSRYSFDDPPLTFTQNGTVYYYDGDKNTGSILNISGNTLWALDDGPDETPYCYYVNVANNEYTEKGNYGPTCATVDTEVFCSFNYSDNSIIDTSYTSVLPKVINNNTGVLQFGTRMGFLFAWCLILVVFLTN